MPFYQNIDPKAEHSPHMLERLLALRQQLDREVPTRTQSETLLLATWNIREFDSPAYGERLPEAFYYIAEIIAHFDLVAIQEVRRDLRALKKLCAILGGHWKYLITDITEGSRGNDERMAFLYDTRKVSFGGLAGELVLPPLQLKDENGKTFYQPVSQVARTPFMCGFRAGWTRFILATVHILYGKSSANNPQRVEEIRQVAQALRSKTLDRYAWARNLILLGDFNIFSPQDKTMQALTDAGFVVPPSLQNLPSNIPQTKYYDQIAFRARDDRFATANQGGIFNYYKSVFRPQDEATYVPYIGKAYHFTSSNQPRQNKSAYYLNYWRTHQMSDHLPMWVELKIDYSDDYLKRKLHAAQN
ncbi:MAG: endonuclease/exonuclease/phosphatase family protein [Anaerolineaceae bacterium]|nr:endonuclease/exonuclease/phosphatase family protein [Anaerolineaceae bacterium]